MNPAQQKVDFKARYGVFPQIYRAPGRVNLIGEHTDYNGGLVMPVAIGFEARVAIAARPDARIRMYSLNYDQTVIVDPALLESSTRRSADAEAHWSDYAIGVIRALRADGIPVCGADLSIDGEVPIGAGLSSSAALELAIAAAFVGIAGRRVEPRRLALLCQQAENEWVGTRCGIMDQYAAAHGRSGHALLLDCRALTHRELPLGDGFPGANRHSAKIVVCNSMVKHRHAGGEYNLRRSECERGLDSLRAAWAADPAAGRGRLESLRDVDAPLLEAHRACLDEVSLRRCRHVVDENARVLAAAAALERGDPLAFGACMYASHASLRDDYAVSCPELDLLVELASSVDGVYGARMTGGGFGGCTVNLIRAEALARFGGRVVDGYRRATGIEPEIYVCNSADGASLLEAA